MEAFMHRLCLYVVLAAVLLAAPVPFSAAQSATENGRISGILKDQKGGVLPGGSVMVRSLDSDLKFSANTDSEGRYSFNSLPGGRYQISAVYTGFQKTSQNDIQIAAGKQLNVDFALIVRPKENLVVITAPVMEQPLVVETDPRAPRQPIPAQDGADYLKTIPGFSIIRKGGTDGDPTFRGMAGSRLNFLLDGQQILGGCGGRMDPPTAYVYPAAYKRITVLKGPQTVLYGPGVSAGTVLFERDRKRSERSGIDLISTAIVGSYGRHDELFDTRAVIPNGYVQAIATRSKSNDYRDGAGASIHSSYMRWSADVEMGWTPTENSYLELSLARSNGRAAYADRMMDGTKFARDNFSVKFDRQQISSVISRVEAQAYYNYIDHVMDNFSLRTPGASFASNNPDRKTTGGRAAITLALDKSTTLVLGIDTQRNVHRARNVTGKSSDAVALAYSSTPLREDMRFSQTGVFGEATRTLTVRSRLIGGFRADRQEAIDNRMCVNATTCTGNSLLKNNTLGVTDHRTLKSEFGRFELDFMRRSTIYVGVGHAERPPDYWERLKQDPVTLKSAFASTRPEKTTQLDTGMVWKTDSWSGSVSGFYGKVHDYILMRWNPAPILTRNIDATTMGGEANVGFRLMENLHTDATLAYVRSVNDTDRKPLAQQPPLEARIGMNYETHAFSFGALARFVGAQNRVDIGSGNIVANGMDIGRTGGFSVFSINGGGRVKRILLITGGIDNLLDRSYAEHLSRAGAMVPGFVQMTRINEPGRTFWLKANFGLE
jgi:iron complex outermembrane recepter protein